jgi:uncharacterized protein (DUF1501 family)
MAMQQHTRREFLKRASAFSMLGTAGPLAMNLAAMSEAAAQTASDYRALVCIFLTGGNDAYNTVLATDAASWSTYTATRTQEPDSIALLKDVAPNTSAERGTPARLGGVLPIEPLTAQPGRSFALHPLLKKTQAYFNLGKLAIVPNVGPLLRPTAKADYTRAGFPLPPRLFSHNDQQSTWQTMTPEGAATGWGGRMADLLAGRNASAGAAFTAISALSNAVWLTGNSVLQYQVQPYGATAVGPWGQAFGSTAALAAIKRSMLGQTKNAVVAESDLRKLASRSFSAQAQLSSAMPQASMAPHGTPGYDAYSDPLLCYTSPLNGEKTYNYLAHQLQAVARIIEARNTLGLKRQVFFVSLGGFDTHDNQNRNHANLLTQLDHALGYFELTLMQLGVDKQVTTFTASDFGRTFTSNGDGSDHGWGGHHFVMGGAVKGGDIHGAFPVYGTNDGSNNFSSPNQITNGSLLPAISVDQYAATLGSWMGVSDVDLLGILPSLTNFTTRNLGFLTA